MDFSGSDWCGWCKKLDEEVFAKPEFLEGAKKDFVLVMVDSPSDKKLLSEKAAEQNPKLVEKYDVHGFPTVLIMDADGTVLDKTGYRRGGPEEYLKNLAEIKKSSAKLITLKRDIAGMAKGTPARLAKIDSAFADATKEQASAPESAKEVYASFIKRLESALKGIEGRGKKSDKAK